MHLQTTYKPNSPEKVTLNAKPVQSTFRLIVCLIRHCIARPEHEEE